MGPEEQLPPSTETDPSFADVTSGEGPDAGTEPPIAEPTAVPEPAVSEPAIAGEASAPRRRSRRPRSQQAAVRMTEARGTEMFPSDDPRAGSYTAGKVYRVPEDIDQGVAEALVVDGGYEWTDRPAEPAGEQ